jgi:hypothetical protein
MNLNALRWSDQASGIPYNSRLTVSERAAGLRQWPRQSRAQYRRVAGAYGRAGHSGRSGEQSVPCRYIALVAMRASKTCSSVSQPGLACTGEFGGGSWHTSRLGPRTMVRSPIIPAPNHARRHAASSGSSRRRSHSFSNHSRCHNRRQGRLEQPAQAQPRRAASWARHSRAQAQAVIRATAHRP